MDAPRRSTRLLAAGGLLLPGFGAGAVMALTGTTASKVRAAAPAKYPGATIERVQTGGPGGPAGGRPAAGPPGCR